MKLNGLAVKLISSASVVCFFVSIPFHLRFSEIPGVFAPSIAFASDGSGSGGSGSGGSGSGSSGSGNSGSGSSGSGSSGSGSSGSGSSGSGSSGSGTNSTSGSATDRQVGDQPENSGRGGKDADIEVHHNNGWTEKIQAGRYILRDAIDRLVIERAATKKDADRLNDSPDR